MSSFLILIIVLALIIIIYHESQNPTKSDTSNLHEYINRKINISEDQKAWQIIQAYAEAVSKEDGIARSLSLLINSKQEIINSYKIYISYARAKNILSTDLFSKLLTTYSVIDAFVEDKNVEIINRVSKHIKLNFKNRHQPNKDIPVIEMEIFENFIESTQKHNRFVEFHKY